MNPFDQSKIASNVRAKMMKNGKYLIAKIEGTVQETNHPEKLLGTHFRYKEYIDNREWLSASLDGIWSPKFLGLVKDIWSVPIEEIKKLEFQNPPHSAAYRLGSDPRNYNKVFTIQLAGCDFDCNYCYVPKQLNAANPKFGRFFSAKEIIDHFVSAKEKSKEPMKVVRISGGNPTILPEIIVDIYNEIENRDMDVYVWIDSNLSTSKYLEKLENSLGSILKQKNIGIVGCFKGVCKEDFALLTGTEPEYYENQFETANWFLGQKSDFYVYLPALVYENNIKEKLRIFIERLRELHENLPLRTEVLGVIDYPAAKLNFERAEKLGRPLPKTDQRKVFDLWYNKLLPQFYSKKDLNRYCCEIPLNHT